MNNIVIVRIKEQIIEKIEKGDYITLGKMLGIAPDTARMRFRRDDKDAVLAMQKLVENRYEFIKTYQKTK